MLPSLSVVSARTASGDLVLSTELVVWFEGKDKTSEELASYSLTKSFHDLQ